MIIQMIILEIEVYHGMVSFFILFDYMLSLMYMRCGKRQCILKISYIRVHKLYYENHALISCTRSKINEKEKFEQVKVIIFNEYAMDSNTFLIDSDKPNIGHSQVLQTQVAPKYVPTSIPVSMAHKDQQHFIKPVFLISQFQKYCRSRRYHKRPQIILILLDK